MPDKDPHNKPLVSAGLIRQYLAGELDDKAMHDLERQALDDPFLADALEGYAMHDPDQQSAQEELTARLAARVAPRKAVVRTMYTRWAAAAAILLLLFTGGWFLFREEPDKAPIASADLPPAIPQAAPQQPEKDAAPAGNKADNNMLADVQTKQADTNSPAAAADDAPKKTKELAYAPKTAKKPAPPVAADATTQDRDLYYKSADARAQKEEPAPVLAAVPAPVTPPPAAIAPPVDERSKALSEVVVAQANRKDPARAYYGAAKQDSATGAIAGGVDALGVSKRARKLNVSPEPVEGYVSYNKYLLSHTVNPDNRFNGAVRISFNVMPDSSLQQFVVVKGLNAACDAEAIRVVKEGPAWKPAPDGKPAKVEVEVIFKVKEN